ncbi:hypothetical protein Pmani_010594 [Petrolisthes manimaculis]|uniref:Uncharacterized protein n=1 Tax=Petrolisthes manimaculis TaxID=1843537 RepID=A0AAE1Q190_9EUCA|nr:hypothetical protein Pmani_010594 [Petrolisthes manimaculis]
MAFNGDGPFNKRMRTDGESVGQKEGLWKVGDPEELPEDKVCRSDIIRFYLAFQPDDLFACSLFSPLGSLDT